MADEKGLALWGGVDLDLTPLHVRRQRCELCGAPATVAMRRLDEQDRRYRCNAHKPSV